MGKQADVLLLKTDTPNLAPLRSPIAAIVQAAGIQNETRCTWPDGR